MLLTNDNGNNKPNKYYDIDSTKLSELVDLLQDFLSVNMFKIGYDRKIKNMLLQQIENEESTIIIKIGDLQNNKKILVLIGRFSNEEIEIALHVALEKSFNCNLYNRKIVFVRVPNLWYSYGVTHYE